MYRIGKDISTFVSEWVSEKVTTREAIASKNAMSKNEYLVKERYEKKWLFAIIIKKYVDNQKRYE